jgi:MoaA/NifB/PqqE/SkfB family radical SAM enzyme
MSVYISDGRIKNYSPRKKQTLEFLNRLKWKFIPYWTTLLYTLVVTDKCTLRCDHCFEEASPDNKTFLNADRVDRLAEESVPIFHKYPSREIRITGGDPFLHQNLYDIIESFSKRKERLGYDCLDIETNGWWATDDKQTKKIVSTLKESGATLLSMTVDYWHEKNSPFPNEQHLSRMLKIAEEVGLEARPINLGMPNFKLKVHDNYIFPPPEVVPIGRARNLPEEYWGEHSMCRMQGCRLSPPTLGKVAGFVHSDKITVESDGNVYPCNSGKSFEHATLALGNIYDKTLPEILKDNKNSIVRLIKRKGVRALTKIAGFSIDEHYAMYDRFSPCGLCHEMLRKYGKEISDSLS